MLKAYFKKTSLKKSSSKKKAYAKPELYPLGRATFLTHGSNVGSDSEKDSNGQEILYNSGG